jgi:hypothetical protein
MRNGIASCGLTNRDSGMRMISSWLPRVQAPLPLIGQHFFATDRVPPIPRNTKRLRG